MTGPGPSGGWPSHSTVLAYEGPISAHAIGGAYRHFSGLARALSARSRPLILMLPSFRGEDTLPLPGTERATVVRIRSTGRTVAGHVGYELRKVRALMSMERDLRSASSELVVISRLSTLGIATIALSLMGTRVIVEVNGLPEFERGHEGRSAFLVWLVRRLTILQLSTSSAAIAVTDGLAQAARERGARRVWRIENGAEAPAADEDPCASGVPWRIVYSGVLAPWHEVDVLLRALAILNARMPEASWHLVVVGDGRERSRLGRLAASLGVQDLVTWLGWSDASTARAAVNSAAVCVAPIRPTGGSATGRSPLKLFEYLSLGRTVVASRIDGTVELDGYPIRFYEHGDAGSLAAALAGAVDATGRGRDTPTNPPQGVQMWDWDERAERVWSLVELNDRQPEGAHHE